MLLARDAAWISVSNPGYSPHELTWTFKLNRAGSARRGNTISLEIRLYRAMLQKQFNHFVKKKKDFKYISVTSHAYRMVSWISKLELWHLKSVLLQMLTNWCEYKFSLGFHQFYYSMKKHISSECFILSFFKHTENFSNSSPFIYNAFILSCQMQSGPL